MDNKESLLGAKYRAASVLASRNSSLLVSSTLKYLNSIIDSDLSGDPILSHDPRYYLCEMVGFVGQIYTQEAYKGLKKYLNFLLTRNPKNKDLLLDWTVYSLASISVEMNQKDSIPILRKSIPDLKLISSEYEALETLAWHFDILNEPAGIKDILHYHAAGENSVLQDKCLELLQKHDPEFVKEYQAQNVNTNTESEDSS